MRVSGSMAIPQLVEGKQNPCAGRASGWCIKLICAALCVHRALLAWAPADKVSYAERMFYFTAVSWLSGTMVGSKPVQEFYVTDEREMPSFHWT